MIIFFKKVEIIIWALLNIAFLWAKNEAMIYKAQIILLTFTFDTYAFSIKLKRIKKMIIYTVENPYYFALNLLVLTFYPYNFFKILINS